MKKLLKSIDVFGHPIGVLYRGNTAHNTVFGSIISLIMIAFLLAFATTRMIDTLNHTNQQISSTKIIVDRDAEGDINLENHHFNLGFNVFQSSVIDDRFDYNHKIPPRIGKWKAEMT